MKKLGVVLALSMSMAGFAQTENETKPEKDKEVESEFYIGFGANVQSNYNLNDKLSNAGLPELNTTVFEFAVGWNVFEEKYSSDIEFGFVGSENDAGTERTRLMGFNSRLRVHYNVVNKEKFAFTGGLNVAYTANQVDIFTPNAVIDLNNLGTKNVTTIRNGMFYIGPSVGVYFFKDKKIPLRLNVGYELALTRGRWKTDFSGLNNTIGEAGNNRFIFGITLF